MWEPDFRIRASPPRVPTPPPRAPTPPPRVPTPPRDDAALHQSLEDADLDDGERASYLIATEQAANDELRALIEHAANADDPPELPPAKHQRTDAPPLLPLPAPAPAPPLHAGLMSEEGGVRAWMATYLGDGHPSVAAHDDASLRVT